MPGFKRTGLVLVIGMMMFACGREKQPWDSGSPTSRPNLETPAPQPLPTWGTPIVETFARFHLRGERSQVFSAPHLKMCRWNHTALRDEVEVEFALPDQKEALKFNLYFTAQTANPKVEMKRQMVLRASPETDQGGKLELSASEGESRNVFTLDNGNQSRCEFTLLRLGKNFRGEFECRSLKNLRNEHDSSNAIGKFRCPLY